MPEKTMESILGELLNTGIEGTFKPNEYGIKKIKEASLAIRQLIKEELGKRLPKEKDGSYFTYSNMKYWQGYNQALTDCKTAIAKYLGRGK